MVQYSTVVILKNSFQFFIFKFPGTLSKKGNQSTVHYVTVPCCNVLYQRCQGTKGAKGVRGLKVSRVPEFKRCQGCQGTKGAKGQKLRRSTWGQGLLKNSSQIELDSWRRSILLTNTIRSFEKSVPNIEYILFQLFDHKLFQISNFNPIFYKILHISAFVGILGQQFALFLP